MKTPRWETFSDGVFAIAITLLIIEIKVPHEGDLVTGLTGLWPSFAAYVASFLYIGTWWMGHHLTGDHLVRADGGYLLLNIIFLLTIAFIPFPTAVLADRLSSGHDAGIAAAFYALSSLLTTVAMNLQMSYALRRRLFGARLTEIEPYLRWRWVGVVVYAAAIPVALAFPTAALVFFIVGPLFYGVVHARQKYFEQA